MSPAKAGDAGKASAGPTGRAKTRTTSKRRTPAEAADAGHPPRVIIEDPRPAVTGVPSTERERFDAKAVVGRPVEVEADIFTDGHDKPAAALRWSPDGETWHESPMVADVNDRWEGRFTPTELGRCWYAIAAWLDHYETWRWGTRRKIDAEVDVSVERREGASLLRVAADRAEGDDADALCRAADTLEGGDDAVIDDDRVNDLMWRHARREPITEVGPLPVWVDRQRAAFSAWYEFFPRSTVGDDPRPGATLADAVDRLDHIAGLGFDVVYLPPVHPIGRTARKGPNNDPDGGPEAVGSPWAIGNEDGGHVAVEPSLGTVDDVECLAGACRERGMELALDLAFQCSPDHPWVTEHPEWFRHRPDGTIHYAENPPKRYQDIYPLDFESEDWWGLWQGLRDVVRFWMERGVRIFRVDNPHTKAFAFWDWMIEEIHATDPDVLFLAEAFTRPKVMHRLGKLGFSQSYTYFTWRYERWELEQYFTELTTRPVVDFMRPNPWPNTPDILTEQLQRGGRTVFYLRAVLAATLAGNYGIYGPAFELVESRPVREGSEEYLNSEKYQVRHWDLGQPHSLAPLLAALNAIRRRHPALQQDRTLHFHPTTSEDLMCYSKRSADGTDVVVCVVNLSANERRNGWVHLEAEALGRQPGEEFVVVDELGGSTYRWNAGPNFVELDPHGLSAHVMAVRDVEDES
jgi:starch synthase (maltosyl-transferring)